MADFIFLAITVLLFWASVAYTRGRVRPFLRASNLSNTSYQEIPGVLMPGRSVLGGIEVIAFSRR